MSSNKLSDKEKEDVVFQRLRKFVWWLANRHKDPNNVMMSVDEIAGELFEELAKGLEVYSDLPIEEMVAVIRRMMDNRVSELKYRYYVTHRNAENRMISIDMEVSVSNPEDISPYGGDVADGNLTEELIEDGRSDPAGIVASRTRVMRTRDKLSNDAREVFDAVIFGNEMLSELSHLSTIRGNVVYKNAKAKLKPFHIADALLIPEGRVKECIKEIRVAYRETLDE